MLNFLITMKGASAVMGIAFGSILVGEVATDLTSGTHVTLGSLIAVCAVVGSGALFIGKWMQKVEGSIKDLKASIAELNRHHHRNDSDPKK